MEIKIRCYAIAAVRVVVFHAGYIYRHIEGRQFIKLIKSLNATCSISYSWNSLYIYSEEENHDGGYWCNC